MRILILITFFLSQAANAQLSVKTTLAELNWLTSEILGDKGSSQSLLSGHEDPHFVDVTPAFIFKIKKIDLLVKNGLALESTWLPKIIELAGNPKLNGAGLCDASANLDTQGKLVKVDRSMGDVHPEGNPHYSYSPVQMIRAGIAIRNCLQKIDKANFDYFEKNFKLLKDKLTKLSERITAAIKLNKSAVLMTYHEEFLYLCHDFKLKCIGTIEDTPGVLPSASRLVKKVKFSQKKQVDLVLATDSNPVKILKKFRELSGVEFVQIEAHMNTKIKTYEGFIEQIAKALQHNGK